ncbi:MAG: hypothetical protein QNJ55_30815 [Xenococcus sp. MO_188.B8]|nr:hypothetical protein [Xenococcus sp. MO_188.B8]
MTDIHTETQEPLTREDQIHLAGWETEAERPLEIEQQYRIKEDAPEATPVEEKPFVRSLFIYGATGLGLLFLLGIWNLMTPKKAPIEIVESTSNETEEVATPQVDYRGKLALRDQKHQLEQREEKAQELPEIVAIEEPVAPTSVPQPPRLQPTTQPRAVRPAPRPTPRPRPTVEPQPRIDPQQRWTQLANFGKGTPLTSSQIAKNQTPSTTTAFVNNTATNPTTINISSSSTPGTQGILNRRTIEPKNDHQIAYGTTVTAEISIPLLWDESVTSSEQPNKRFALTLTENLLASNGQVALTKGTVLVAETSSVNPGNRLVNATAVAIISTNQQGKLQQRSIPPQKLAILGKQQEPLIAKGYFDRGGDYTRTDLLVSYLSGLGKVGEVFTEPNTSSSVITNGFNSSISTTVDNSNREVWAAALDGFFNPLAERLSDRSLRGEKELEKLPNIAVLEVGIEVTIIANDTFALK